MVPAPKHGLVTVPVVLPTARPGVAAGRPILVVEDDPVLRALECMVLADAGHPALQGPNGQAVLAAVRRVPPLAVITDVRMPEMDGPTFVRRYRAWCATPPPVIALSGSPGGLAEAAAAGVEVTLA